MRPLALQMGQAVQAAQLTGAAQASRQALGKLLTPRERTDHKRHIAALREALGETGFNACLAVGRALTLQEAAARALSQSHE